LWVFCRFFDRAANYARWPCCKHWKKYMLASNQRYCNYLLPLHSKWPKKQQRPGWPTTGSGREPIDLWIYSICDGSLWCQVGQAVSKDQKPNEYNRILYLVHIWIITTLKANYPLSLYFEDIWHITRWCWT
jgi:hypothetical protein